MRTVLIYFFATSLLGIAACSNLTLVHHVEIQQGNVVTQQMVDNLTLGMTQRQVQVVMGTPLVVDVFDQNRWDYPYKLLNSKGAEIQRNVSLYFEDDRLVKISGDLKPSESAAPQGLTQEKVSVTVPYQNRERQGVLTRFWRFLTFRNRGAAPE